jgi:hypothetical protein
MCRISKRERQAPKLGKGELKKFAVAVLRIENISPNLKKKAVISPDTSTHFSS